MPSEPLPHLAYRLPEWMPTEWHELHGSLLTRMRDELQRMVSIVTTMHELMVERITYNYVVMRYKETTPEALRQFANDRAHKEFNVFIYQVGQDLQKELAKADALDVAREALRAQFVEATAIALADLPPSVRQAAGAKLMEALESV